MENLLVVKVVETVVTVYTVKGDFNSDEAEKLVERYHSLESNEAIDHMEKVKKEATTTDFKAQVQYQLVNDRPKAEQKSGYGRR